MVRQPAGKAGGWPEIIFRRFWPTDDPCRLRSADDEGFEFLDQVVAVIGIDLQRDRLGKVQAEDTENRLRLQQ